MKKKALSALISAVVVGGYRLGDLNAVSAGADCGISGSIHRQCAGRQKRQCHNTRKSGAQNPFEFCSHQISSFFISLIVFCPQPEKTVR